MDKITSYKKKILFLGAAQHQIPPITYARNQGYYVITCDYLPENPGHKLADESYNISTTDQESIFKLAKSKGIDAIIAYASDPAASTQAYVAEKLNLPSNPLQAVDILSNKKKFRDYIANHGFNAPKAESFTEKELARQWVKQNRLPLIIKPVDSSGSKGVSKIDTIEKLENAFEKAQEYSRSNEVIIEELIIKEGKQIDGDAFVVDGSLLVFEPGDQHNDHSCNPYAPTAISFPSQRSQSDSAYARKEIQRLLKLLDYKIGAINFEYIFDKNGQLYILEIGPRNGGNRIPEAVKEANGIDMIAATVEIYLDKKVSLTKKNKTTPHCSYVIHSQKDGTLKEIEIDKKIKNNIKHFDTNVEKGGAVKKYTGSDCTVASAILCFESKDEMNHHLKSLDQYFKVLLNE